MTVRLRVPATTANLGPGFDCLGMALNVYNYMSGEETNDSKVSIYIGGSAAHPGIPTDENNLAFRALKHIYDITGRVLGGVRMNLELEAPLARGMGSSSSAIVGGMALANELLGRPLDNDALLYEMVQMEGHPDNVVPCFVGGLTASLSVENRVVVERVRTHEDLRYVLFVPAYELETSRARAAIPPSIPVKNAVFSASRVIHVFNRLQSGSLEGFQALMADKIHQPYRTPLIKAYDEVEDAAVNAGAAAVAISGAGPTILAVCRKDVAEAVAAAGSGVLTEIGIGCKAIVAEADYDGTVVLS